MMSTRNPAHITREDITKIITHMSTRNYNTVWADFHTHILPNIDDGSHDAATSAKMLCELYCQGIGYVALTPHYLHENESTEEFCARREVSYNDLIKVYNEKTMPRLCLGAEVFLSKGLTKNNLRPLCYGNTNILLFEFPEEKFQYWMIDEIEQLTYVQKLIPMVAHIDRVFNYFTEKQLIQLFEFGDFIFQINNDALLSHKTRAMIKAYFNDELPIVLGSDTHDLQHRKPNFNKAKKALESISMRRIRPALTNTNNEIAKVVFN